MKIQFCQHVCINGFLLLLLLYNNFLSTAICWRSILIELALLSVALMFSNIYEKNKVFYCYFFFNNVVSLMDFHIEFFFNYLIFYIYSYSHVCCPAAWPRQFRFWICTFLWQTHTDLISGRLQFHYAQIQNYQNFCSSFWLVGWLTEWPNQQNIILLQCVFLLMFCPYNFGSEPANHISLALN